MRSWSMNDGPSVCSDQKSVIKEPKECLGYNCQFLVEPACHYIEHLRVPPVNIIRLDTSLP